PDGNLWIGTRRGGVMRLSGAGFRTFSEADGLVFSGDDKILQTRSDLICVAAIGDPRRPVRCHDGQKFRAMFPRLPPDVLASAPTSQQSTIQDHLGAWWISSGRGLLRFPGEQSHAPGSPDLRLVQRLDTRQLYEDSRGDVWVVTQFSQRFGLMRWE